MDGNQLVAGTLYREIRERILSGQYAPGSVLRQEDIARQFETSRVPLREAFSKLEAEGFLILRPRRGYAVISLEPEEIAEIFDLRTVIEGHAGQIATRMQKPGDAEALEALLAEMAETNPLEQEGMTRWCELNRAFHERILECCNRPRLQRIALQLRDQVEPYVRVELAVTGDVAEATRDHEEIVSAFRSGDAELVGELCAVHCSRTARRLLDKLRAPALTADEDR
ncbi:GntR family transcriptional regulator [Mangrovicoccus sp. HB161399]|uniref:GntR family transcriptional regulator n=1 Tax=Mangrovicoccus sp. HB161399 TaxID=2720392 RepID=UPI00155336A8|nr:GntR family transcriptional regulator [Mangrovicoccus sp. HB161399]